MRRILLLMMCMGLPAGLLAGDTAADLDARVEASRAVTQEFMQTLKGALQQAIKEGGAVNAIAVCNEKAPAIAGSMSENHGWRVARTSLKVRNTDNAPDAWERGVLEQFDARRGRGEDPAVMEYAEIVTRGGKQEFRYMKAIPTGEVCLVCHGSTIDTAVAGKLEAMYPADQATGYQVGDIRGAFTITQPK